MRQIKFRAWDNLTQTMYPWDDLFAGSMQDFQLAPFEWMQSTGRADRSGTEIFEGDILDYYAEGYRILKYRKPVVWKQYSNHTGFNLGNPKNFEVVGNIYENPELLK